MRKAKPIEGRPPTVEDNPDPHRHSCDVLLVTATDVEFDTVRRLAEKRTGSAAISFFGKTNAYLDLGLIGEASVVLARSEMGSHTVGGSLATVLDAIIDVNPSVVIAVGIAFGINKAKQKISCILVSSMLGDYSSEKRATDPDGKPRSIHRGVIVAAPPNPLARFRAAPLTSKGREVQFGLLLTGPVLVDNREFRDKLLVEYPEAIGGEMEGVGVYAACQQRGVDWIIVKAVCDWADGNKRRNKSRRQAAASAAAADFVLDALEMGGFARAAAVAGQQNEPGDGGTVASAVPCGGTSSDTHPSSLFEVPLPANPFFLGRDELLDDLRRVFLDGGEPAVQVLVGIPGVGKSQIAAAYAYKWRDDYKSILWIPSASVTDALSQFVETAHRLGLPDANDPDQKLVVREVLRCVENHGPVLLILDSIVDGQFLADTLKSVTSAHVLVTSTSAGLGALGQTVGIEPLPAPEAAKLLLYRAGVLGRGDGLEAASESERLAAQTMANVLGGLPLALDQAGAFAAETPSTLTEYLELYEKEGARLRSRRGEVEQGHASVAVTFALALRTLKSDSRPAVDLLRLSAFVGPDPVPEEIFRKGLAKAKDRTRGLSNEIEFAAALAAAGRLALITRDPVNRTISLHTLVCDCIAGAMSPKQRRKWAGRAVRAFDAVFPYVDHESWPQCLRLVPHAAPILRSIQAYQVKTSAAVRALNQIGTIYLELGRYESALEFLEAALSAAKSIYGRNDVKFGMYLNNLSVVCEKLGNWYEAERYARSALKIYSRARGERHRKTAAAYNNLGRALLAQGRYSEAEAVLLKALEGRVHGTSRAQYLDNIAQVLMAQHRTDEAIDCYRRALSMREKLLGPHHPRLAETLNNLATPLSETGKLDEATGLYDRALAILDANPELVVHPSRAVVVHNIGCHLGRLGQNQEAERLLRESIDLASRTTGPHSLQVAESTISLGALHFRLGSYVVAEDEARQALAVAEVALGAQHPELPRFLLAVASSLRALERDDEAVVYEARAERIQAQAEMYVPLDPQARLTT